MSKGRGERDRRRALLLSSVACFLRLRSRRMCCWFIVASSRKGCYLKPPVGMCVCGARVPRATTGDCHVLIEPELLACCGPRKKRTTLLRTKRVFALRRLTHATAAMSSAAKSGGSGKSSGGGAGGDGSKRGGGAATAAPPPPPSSPEWCVAAGPGKLRLLCSVVPNASSSEVAGEIEGALRVRLAAPPVDGKANEALIAFLAKALGVPKRAVEVTHGTTSRQKTLSVVSELSPAAAAELLLR